MLPMAEFFLSLILLFGALALLAVFFRGWLRVLGRWWHGGTLGPLEGSLGLVPWGLGDLVGLTLLIVFLQTLAAALLAHRFNLDPTISPTDLPAGPQVYFVAGLAAANLAWTLLALAAMKLVRQASLRELGLQPARWAADIRSGAIAFCMLAPIVYAIQGILVLFWPSRHPLIQMIREDRSPLLVLFVGFAACVAAPIFEEFAFRMFFQGWLQNCMLLSGRGRQAAGSRVQQATAGARVWDRVLMGLALHERRSVNRGTLLDESGASHVPSEEGTGEAELTARQTDPRDDSLDERGQANGADRSSPLGYLPDTGSMDDSSYTAGVPGMLSSQGEFTEAAAERSPRLVAIPILISSLTFALMHYSHGPDWIPLIVLALGLGYLYQRTQRILPCIVVHALLNSVSFSMLLVEMLLRPLPLN